MTSHAPSSPGSGWLGCGMTSVRSPNAAPGNPAGKGGDPPPPPPGPPPCWRPAPYLPPEQRPPGRGGEAPPRASPGIGRLHTSSDGLLPRGPATPRRGAANNGSASAVTAPPGPRERRPPQGPASCPRSLSQAGREH